MKTAHWTVLGPARPSGGWKDLQGSGRGCGRTTETLTGGSGRERAREKNPCSTYFPLPRRRRQAKRPRRRKPRPQSPPTASKSALSASWSEILVGFIGTTVNDLATPRRKPSQPKRQRLLYRRAASLTSADLDRLVVEIGPARLMAALDRYTQPSLPLIAAE